MVSCHTVDNSFGFLIFTQHFDTDINVSTFSFVIQSFTDIMQQPGSLCQCHIQTQFASHQTCQLSHLDGMLQYILSVRRSVLQASQQFNQLRMEVVDAHIEGCLFTGLFDDGFHFSLRFFYHFLDPCRMDSPIHDQLFEGQSCDLSSYRIKTGQDHSFRRIVDDQIDSCQRFDRTNVTTFTTDDPAFHFIVRKRYYRYRGFCHVIGSTTLDRSSDDFFRFLVCIFLGLALNVLIQGCRIAARFLFYLLQYDFSCVFRRVAGDLF